jgi:hypothetical protein
VISTPPIRVRIPRPVPGPLPRQHNHTRYAGAVTIALGLLVDESVVIGADTEISYGALKSEGCKIYWPESAGGDLVVTGAGGVDYIEAVYQELKSIFLRHPSASIQDIEDRFKKELKDFYREHVVPFAQYPLEERPEFALIISIRRHGTIHLWETAKNTMRRPLSSFAAIGIGEAHARDLFNLLDRRMGLGTAIALAAYSIFRVKEIANYVGKSTSIIWVQKEGLPVGLQGDQIHKLEEFFRFYRDLEAMLVHRALGNDNPFSGVERIQSLIEHVRGSVKDLIHPNRPVNADRSQT